MTEDKPVACSLGAGDLEQRLAAIAEIGADSLISSEIEGGRHLLHFRSSEPARRGLEEITAAESECCPFLDLSLSEKEDDLVLSIAAPEGGQAVADGLAAAFRRSGGMSGKRTPGRGALLGAGGLLFAVCCIAGPAILGAAAGAAIGSVLGIGVAVLVAVAVAIVLHRRRAIKGQQC